MQQRIASRFSRVCADNSRQKKRRHSAPDRPSMLLRACHAAQRVGKARGYGKNQNDLNEVSEWIRIFVGMRAVGVEKTAAIGTEHFDGFLRRHGPLRDQLGSNSLLCCFAVRAGHLHSLWI